MRARCNSVSLVLLHLLPEAGLAFLLVSISIAVGAVLGRYHYAAIDIQTSTVLTFRHTKARRIA